MKIDVFSPAELQVIRAFLNLCARERVSVATAVNIIDNKRNTRPRNNKN